MVTTYESTKSIRITPNFLLSEFLQSGGVPQMPPLNELDSVLNNIADLAQQMQIIRNEINNEFAQEHFIRVTSGYRTLTRNTQIGGAKNSRHLIGQACDFQVINRVTRNQLSPIIVGNILLKLMNENKIVKGGLGVYFDGRKQSAQFVHYDIGRNGKITHFRKR